MEKGLDCFVVYAGAEATLVTLKQLKEEPLVNNIYVLMPDEKSSPFMGCGTIRVDNIRSTETLRQIHKALTTQYALICMAKSAVTLSASRSSMSGWQGFSGASNARLIASLILLRSKLTMALSLLTTRYILFPPENKNRRQPS